MASFPGSDSPEEAALKTITRQFFAAQEKNDLSALTALCSRRSPDYGLLEKEMRDLFAKTSRTELMDLKFNRVKIEADKAVVRIWAKYDRFDAKTGQSIMNGVYHTWRTLHFVKEDGAWKIWSYVRSLDELAARLAEADDNQTRERLLADHSDLLIPELIWACNQPGQRAYFRGEYAQAITFDTLAYEIAERLGNRLGMAIALNNLGNVYNDQGDYRQALECFQRCLEISKSLPEKDAREGLMHLTNNIGELHKRQGNYDLALSYYRQSLQLAEEFKSDGQRSVRLINIGGVYADQGKYDQAVEMLEQSLALSRQARIKRVSAAALTTLGEVYMAKGNFERAMDFLKQGLAEFEQIPDKAGKAAALATLAQAVYATRAYPEAIEYADRAAAIAAEINLRETLWQARTIAGQCERALNRPRQAREAFEESIKIIEQIRSQAAGGERDTQRLLAHKLSPYREMVRLLVEQQDWAEALSFAERGKARVLLDVLRNGRVDITKAMTAAEQQRERSLNDWLAALNAQLYAEQQSKNPNLQRVADLNAQLREARLEQESFLTNLYNAHPNLKAQRGQPPSFRLEHAAELLADARTALLEFVLAEDRTFLFVLTREKSKASPDLRVYGISAAPAELGKLATEFRETLAERNLLFRQPASKLYDLLLRPAEKQLRGKTNLVIVPDGALWDLPFEALLSTGSANGRAGAQRFLIQDFAISRAPSLAVLAEMASGRRPRSESTGAPSLLAFGNPALAGDADAAARLRGGEAKLAPLPQTENEVREIAKLYGQARSRVYLGAAAREDKLKAEARDFRILHVATHGLLNDANPMYSQIVLSQSGNPPGEDGLLEARELMNLELTCDLVVLSACETARGGIAPGEGVIGLSWALFVAGSPTTVVSQWKVDSASTTQLMKEFHRQLLNPVSHPVAAQSKAEALRAAALKLMRGNYRHPFYWAGFVVVGDAF